ncbi:MAG: rod shape-determining protein MreD [Tannerella sp.]|jgi:rod shape-determining protein MreD|nr:rod shape-determining protein MreD [Tannerella sp.]
MIKSYVKVLLYFILFVALQVLVLNNIQLFRTILSLLYIYVIIKIPINLTKISVIIISFLLGLVIDIFVNTLGLHAAACTLIGFARQPLLNTFSEKDMIEDVSPSYATLGVGSFIRYTLSIVVLHHTALYLIESLSLFDPLFLCIRITGSIILTSLCIFVVEAFNIDRKGGNS